MTIHAPPPAFFPRRLAHAGQASALGIPPKSTSPVSVAAVALMNDACGASGPPVADVITFQSAYNLATSGSTGSPLNNGGTYDDATVAALYQTTGQIPPCPSSQLVALAQAVIADATVCQATATAPNANIQAFMASYLSWQNPTATGLTPDVTYTAAVQSALGQVLPSAALPNCLTIHTGGPTPTPPTPPVGGGSPPVPVPGTGSSAAVSSNAGLYVTGGVALLAIGALVWMNHAAIGGAGAAAAAAAGPKRNPTSRRSRGYPKLRHGYWTPDEARRLNRANTSAEWRRVYAEIEAERARRAP